MGNVQPSEVMLEGTPATVRIAVLNGLRQAYDAPRGYIVASGCSLPTETPFANIDAMMHTVRQVGYPVTAERLESLIHDTIN
jgi:uroporphyrinogen decarboxylase